MTFYNHWTDVPETKWVWPDFTPEEMADSESGALLIVHAFMSRLQLLRDTIGQPLSLSSAYRTPEHNARISRTGDTGPHTTGRAADVRCFGEKAFRLIGISMGLGFTGIGVFQKGPHERRFIHVDDLGTGRPTIWSY